MKVLEACGNGRDFSPLQVPQRSIADGYASIGNANGVVGGGRNPGRREGAPAGPLLGRLCRRTGGPTQRRRAPSTHKRHCHRPLLATSPIPYPIPMPTDRKSPSLLRRTRLRRVTIPTAKRQCRPLPGGAFVCTPPVPGAATLSFARVSPASLRACRAIRLHPARACACYAFDCPPFPASQLRPGAGAPESTPCLSTHSFPPPPCLDRHGHSYCAAALSGPPPSVPAAPEKREKRFGSTRMATRVVGKGRRPPALERRDECANTGRQQDDEPWR